MRTRRSGIRDNGLMAADPLPPSQGLLEPEDYYMEGPNLVFTAAYHLKRGYCCGAGCKHCPYGHSAVPRTSLQRPETDTEGD